MPEEIGRVYVGVWENDDKEIWSAANQEVRMDYLVSLSPLPGVTDTAILKRYEKTLIVLSMKQWPGKIFQPRIGYSP